MGHPWCRDNIEAYCQHLTKKFLTCQNQEYSGLFSNVIIICLEKRSFEAMEGHVLEISKLKRSKSESKTDSTWVFQQKGTMRAACFSPDKWKLLHQFQRDNRSCVISKVVRTKPTEVKLINRYTVKGKHWCFQKTTRKKILPLIR